ncbi:MAG: C4-type zinc ribbon domain-containing protein, partial [bacterium]
RAPHSHCGGQRSESSIAHILAYIRRRIYMPTLDLKSQLHTLINLQAIDTEIYILKAEIEAKPKELQAIEDAFEAKKQQLANLEKSSLDLQKQRKDKELELASREDGVKKLQTQLYQLKTNKEYQTMMQQINDAKADGSVIEDKILELFNQVDQAKDEIDKEKQKLQEEETVISEQKGKIEQRIKEIDDRIAQLDGQRKQVFPSIDAKILAQYDRILTNRDGLAIVSVKDNSCLGCNMYVPPQVINLIKMYECIITCEICNRILYINEGD